MGQVDFNEIMIFAKVVQVGSFSKAGKILGLPNSTVSAKVSSLESRLGVTLLHRTTRQLSLTALGQEYFNQCLIGIEEIMKAETSLVANQSGPQGNFKITSPVLLGDYFLPDIIASFSKKYPKVNIEVVLSDKTVDLVAEGVDLAIRAGKLKDSSLIAKKLGVAYFAPFASPAYLKKNAEPNHPKDLAEHNCLQFAPLGRDSWEFQNGRSTVSVAMNGKMIIDELALIKSLALAGNGIALLPTFICGEESSKGKLVRLLSGWQSNERAIHFVYPPNRFMPPNLKAFMDMSVDIIKTKLSELEI